MRVCRQWMLLMFSGLILSACASTWQPHQGPALWVVEADGERLWLFGTIHRLPDYTRMERVASRRGRNFSLIHRIPPMPWRTIAVRRAMLDADRLLVELVPQETLNIVQAMRNQLAAHHTTNQTPLLDFLTPEQTQSVTDAARHRGLDPAIIDEADPLLVFSLFANTQPDVPGLFQPGADFWLLYEARQRKLPIAGLETLEQRLDALFNAIAQLTTVEQAQVFLRYLETELAELDVNDPEYQELIHLWINGETTTLAQRMHRYADYLPILHDAFIRARNHQWLAHIQSVMNNQENEFVAVGIGHLVGPDNLLALLREAGYQPRRVQ